MSRRTSRWAAPTYVATGVLFVGALGGIAAQVQAGADPALGAPVVEPTIPQPHYIVTRRVATVRVVVRRVRDLPPLAPRVTAASAPAYAAPASGAPAYAAPSSGGSGGSAPASAPAPVAAPAPAPAPAVSAPVTRAS
jgi:hypothetical protein